MFAVVCWLTAATLIKLQRIQNKSLWDFYSARKTRMCTANGTPNPQERRGVWHGTRHNDPSVIYEDVQDGFMMQYCEAGMWGRGLYFAKNAKYSNDYAWSIGAGRKTMMYTRLLTGEEIHMPPDSNIKVPPVRPGKLRYDTISGDTNGSKVYIVYENGRACE